MDVGTDVSANQELVKDDLGNRCLKLFQDFLQEWMEGDVLKYVAGAKELSTAEKNTLQVSFDDVIRYNAQLSQHIQEQYYRVYPYICRALRNFVRDKTETIVEKEYYVSFTDVLSRQNVRELTTAKIGSLLRISGQVVRAHPVHPELISGTFTCLECQTVIKDVEQQFKYTQPSMCRNPVCNNRVRFSLDVDKSRFVDFQKCRIQEVQSELPRGSIPRSVEVILRGDSVEMAQAGDRCDFVGTLIVVPDVGALSLPGARAESSTRLGGGENASDEGVSGLKALGVRELNYRMAFLACTVLPTNPKFGGRDNRADDMTAEAVKKQMTVDEWETVYEMSRSPNLFSELINSLFPTIHGSEEVKKGILLMLFGGVPKQTLERTSLRGDINICIVGDPSTAKSQFLKQVTDFSPRAIYTSGKASTAAGLTAAVVKDEESHEFVIEAGALMLADNGVCCIDEFDKMDVKDQVAIHEAMEQQTISITKAGVKATLNARTSILAAANPIGGRYDRTKSLRMNIQLSPPIMSRFDLFFILVDECNEITDYAIARRIVELHRCQEESLDRVYTQDDIRKYILFARQFKPKLTKEASDKLVEQYRHLRKRDGTCGSKSAWRITVRQLESMIRLSEAMARMHCSDDIEVNHVKEAFRLLNKSIIRIEQAVINLDEDPDSEHLSETIDTVSKDRQLDISGVEAMDTGDQEEEVMDSQKERGSGAAKGDLTLTYDEYKTLANVLILYVSREEERQEEEGGDGVKMSDVVNWYLEETQNEINTEAELIKRKLIVEKVIGRLIHKDKILISLTRKGLTEVRSTGDTDPGERAFDDDALLVLHPNYVFE